MEYTLLMWLARIERAEKDRKKQSRCYEQRTEYENLPIIQEEINSMIEEGRKA